MVLVMDSSYNYALDCQRKKEFSKSETGYKSKLKKYFESGLPNRLQYTFRERRNMGKILIKAFDSLVLVYCAHCV